MNNKLLKTTKQVQRLCVKLGLRKDKFQVPSDHQAYLYCKKHGDYYKSMMHQRQIERQRFNEFKKRAKNEYKHRGRQNNVSRQRTTSEATANIRDMRADRPVIQRILQLLPRAAMDRVVSLIRR